MPCPDPSAANAGPPPEKRVLSVDEYCEYYVSGRTTAYEDIKSGRLKAKKRGRRTIITRESAEALLASLPDLDTTEAA